MEKKLIKSCGSKKFFTKIFGGLTETKSKGIEGLIKEAKEIMNEEMTAETMDAAIIGVIQKIQHYEIAGYGTAYAYAKQLELDFVAGQLNKSLKEVREADLLLTTIAENVVNIDSAQAPE